MADEQGRLVRPDALSAGARREREARRWSWSVAVWGADARLVAQSITALSVRLPDVGVAERCVAIVLPEHQHEPTLAHLGCRVVASPAAAGVTALTVACTTAPATHVLAVAGGTHLAIEESSIDGLIDGLVDLAIGVLIDVGGKPTGSAAAWDAVLMPTEPALRVEPRLRGPGGSAAVAVAAGACGRGVVVEPAIRLLDVRLQTAAFAAHDWSSELRNDLIAREIVELQVEASTSGCETSAAVEAPDSNVSIDVGTELDRECVAIAEVRLDLERRSPFWLVDAIAVVNLDRDRQRWLDMCRRAAVLGFGQRMERWPAIDDRDYPLAGSMRSHRRVIEDAWRRRLDTVLILEDDVVFRRDTLSRLATVTPLLSRDNWDVAYLGGDRTDWPDSFSGDESTLRHVDGAVYNFHAQIIHRRAFEHLLDILPATVEEVTEACELHGALSSLLSREYEARRLRPVIVWPRVAAQADQLTPRRLMLTPTERAEFVI